MSDTYSYFDIDSIDPSPTNPRKNVGDIAELVESIKQHGIIEPPVLRNSPTKAGRFELVCGERRWTAAKRAGLKQLQGLLRNLSDDEVLDIQLAENIDRADLTPFEEAQAFELRLKRGQTIAHIADRIGRTPSYVAQRVKLLTLSAKCREALEAGHLTLGLALLIARLPDPKLQDEALERVGGSEYDVCMKTSEAAKELEQELMMRLEKAPFDVTDAALVPKAGACSACPKRTGNQRELFADVASPDLCTDRSCFRGKLDATWKATAKAAKAKGIEVLSAKDAEKVGGQYSSSTYLPLSEKVWAGQKQVSVKQLFEKDEPPILLAQDPKTRMPVKVVTRADVERATKRFAAAHTKSKPGSASAGSSAQSAEDRKRKIRKAAIDRARRVPPPRPLACAAGREGAPLNILSKSDVTPLRGV